MNLCLIIICCNSLNNYMPMYMIFLHWNTRNTFSDIVIFYNYMFCPHAYLLSYLSISIDPLLSRYDPHVLTDCSIHNMHIKECTSFLLRNIHNTFLSNLSFYMCIHFWNIFSFSQWTLFTSKTLLKSTIPKNLLHRLIPIVGYFFRNRSEKVWMHRKLCFY